MQRLAHPDGEVGTSKACAAANIAMGLSAYATDSLEDVIKQGEGKTNPYAMQVSLFRNRDLTLQLLKRAESKSKGRRTFSSID
jgi:(S)-2-hydroxy-acid oxidase